MRKLCLAGAQQNKNRPSDACMKGYGKCKGSALSEMEARARL